MKQLRNVSALLIALALVLTMVPMSGLIAFAEEAVDATVTTDAPAESETTAPVEEVSEETAEAAALLQSLNVLKGDESGNLNLTGDVTRAEFATFVVRMIGQEEVALASAGKQIFDDVAADHWGNGYIDVAYNAKIIQGYGDGNFGPDAPVTYEQAIKMIVCALGYGDSANEKGGWPSGYLRVANEMKITKGVKVSGGQPAKRGDIVSMIYNSLEIDVLRANKAIKDGIEGVSYTVVKGDNVLTYFLGLEKAEGIVTANAFTRIDSTAAVDDDVIVLSYVDEFEVGAIDADGFLGQSVSIYYELDAKKGKKNIVFIKPQAENIVTVVDGDDIVPGETNLSELVWEDGEDEAYYELNEDASVVVNKRFKGFLNSIDLSTITPDNGTVTLIDNDGDEAADVILVDAFQTLIVDKIDTVSVAVIDKYTETSYGLYTGSKYYDCTVKDKAGKDVDVKKLKEWDVVCLYQSGDNKVRNAVVCTEKVKGKLTKKAGDGKIAIDGTAYEFSNAYLNYLEANEDETPELGSTYTFLLDINGKIAGCQIDKMTLEANQSYGYLISAKKDVLTGRARLKIYTAKGEIKTISTAEMIEVNGYPKDSGSTDKTDLLFINEERSRVLKEISSEELIDTRAYFNNILASGAILYKTNTDGEICELLVDTSDTNAYGTYKDYYDGLFVQAVGENTSLAHYGGVFGGKYRITTKTTVLQIPQNLDDDDLYNYGPVVTAGFTNAKDYVLDLYDVKEDGEVGLAVYRPAYTINADLYYDSGRLFFTYRDMTQQVNADDEVVSVINYGVDDAVKSLEVASSERFKNLDDLDAEELVKRSDVGDAVKEVYESYNASAEINVNYNYTSPADVNDLLYGDAIVIASSMSKAASVAPLLKLTTHDVNTGAEISLRDVHFEYGRSSLVVSDTKDVTGAARLANLLDDSLPFDDRGFENPSGRTIYFGEAIEGASTYLTFFTTTHMVDGQLVRTKRMVPTGTVDQILFIDMTEGTIKTGSSSSIQKGDKVLVNFRYDLANNCYIYVYRW